MEMKSCFGPKNGSLLIFGGGSNGFYEEFMKLAGGPKSKIVVIPTALYSGIIEQENLESFKNRFINRGFRNVTVLHTRSRKEANTKKFVQPILEADGIWFSGGRHWRHVDSYLNTLSHDAFNDLLERGGVIAGGSAGASIQGSYLARGDSKTNNIIIGDHQKGLGFIRNTAIDQHHIARNRQFEMFEIINKEPDLLGLGIDEDTAIVVQGNQFRVIGRSYVAIYDGTSWSSKRNQFEKLPTERKEFYFLRAGQDYDLKNKRKVFFKDRKLLDFSKKRFLKYIGKYFNKKTNSNYLLYFEKKSLILQKALFPDQSIILQESESRFFIKDSDFCLEFELFKNGKVKGFHFLPRNTYWKKID